MRAYPNYKSILVKKSTYEIISLLTNVRNLCGKKTTFNDIILEAISNSEFNDELKKANLLREQLKQIL